MNGRRGPWKALFKWPDLVPWDTRSSPDQFKAKQIKYLARELKRTRFTATVWRPRTLAFLRGHKPIGHMLKGIKMDRLQTLCTFDEKACAVTGEAEDKNVTCLFDVTFRIRTPLLERQYETVRENTLNFSLLPPSLAKFPKIDVKLDHLTGERKRPKPIEEAPRERNPDAELPPAAASVAATPAPVEEPAATTTQPADAPSASVSETVAASDSGEAAAAAGALTYPVPVLDGCKLPVGIKLADGSGNVATDVIGMPAVYLAIDPLDISLMNTVEAINVTVDLLTSAQENPNPSNTLLQEKAASGLVEALKAKSDQVVEAISGGAVSEEQYVAQMKQDQFVDQRLAVALKKEGRTQETLVAFQRYKQLKECLDQIG